MPPKPKKSTVVSVPTSRFKPKVRASSKGKPGQTRTACVKSSVLSHANGGKKHPRPAVSRPKAGYTLYSTDSEEQIKEVDKGIDRCAGIVKQMLEARRGRAATGKGRLKVTSSAPLANLPPVPPCVTRETIHAGSPPVSPKQSNKAPVVIPTACMEVNSPYAQPVIQKQGHALSKQPLFNKRLATSTPDPEKMGSGPTNSDPTRDFVKQPHNSYSHLQPMLGTNTGGQGNLLQQILDIEPSPQPPVMSQTAGVVPNVILHPSTRMPQEGFVHGDSTSANTDTFNQNPQHLGSITAERQQHVLSAAAPHSIRNSAWKSSVGMQNSGSPAVQNFVPSGCMHHTPSNVVYPSRLGCQPISENTLDESEYQQLPSPGAVFESYKGISSANLPIADQLRQSEGFVAVSREKDDRSISEDLVFSPTKKTANKTENSEQVLYDKHGTRSDTLQLSNEHLHNKLQNSRFFGPNSYRDWPERENQTFSFGERERVSVSVSRPNKVPISHTSVSKQQGSTNWPGHLDVQFEVPVRDSPQATPGGQGDRQTLCPSGMGNSASQNLTYVTVSSSSDTQYAAQSPVYTGAHQNRASAGTSQIPVYEGVPQYPAYTVGQQNPVFQGAQQNPAFPSAKQNLDLQGAQQNPAFQGAQQNPAFQGAQQNQAFQGAQQNPAFQGAQQNPAFQGAQQNPAFQGAQQNPAFQGVQQNQAFQGAQQSQAFQGAQQIPPVQGAQQNPVYVSSQQNPAYIGSQPNLAYLQAVNEVESGSPRRPVAKPVETEQRLQYSGSDVNIRAEIDQAMGPLIAENRQLRSELRIVNQQLKDLERDWMTQQIKEREKRAGKSQTQSKQPDLEQELQVLTLAQNKVKSLEAELVTERLRGDDLQTQLRQSQRDLEQYKNDRQKLLVVLGEKDSEKLHLRQKNQQEISRLHAELQLQQKQVETFRLKLDTSEKESHILGISLKQGDSEINRLQELVQTMKASMSDLIKEQHRNHGNNELSSSLNLQRLERLLREGNVNGLGIEGVIREEHQATLVTEENNNGRQYRGEFGELTMDALAVHNERSSIKPPEQRDSEDEIVRQKLANVRLLDEDGELSSEKSLTTTTTTASQDSQVSTLSTIKDANEEVSVENLEVNPSKKKVHFNLSRDQDATSHVTDDNSTVVSDEPSRYSVTDYFKKYPHSAVNSSNQATKKAVQSCSSVEKNPANVKESFAKGSNFRLTDNGGLSSTPIKTLRQPPLRNPFQPSDEDVNSVTSGVTLSSVSTLATVDESVFREGLANLDANIARLQESLQQKKALLST